MKENVNLAKAVIGASLLVLAAWLALYCRYRRIVLGPNSIESHGVLFHRTIVRNSILGWRALPGRWTRLIEIIPREAGAKGLLIQMWFETDELFYTWFSSLPYLGKRDAAKHQY
jgi:hypothetical protein